MTTDSAPAPASRRASATGSSTSGPLPPPPPVTTLPLAPFASSFIAAPLSDGPDGTGTLAFQHVDTPLGRIWLHLMFQFNGRDTGLTATLTLRRSSLASPSPASAAPPSLWMTPRQPLLCTLTLATTLRTARHQIAILPPQVIALDKDVPVASYLATIPYSSIDPALTVYEARIRIEPMSATDSVAACPFLYLATLDVPALSDCALAVAGGAGNGGGEATQQPPPQVLVYVSKAMLAARSPFFKSMFSGPWAESSVMADGKPILGMDKWPLAALIPCLIHVYCGWLPGSALPTNVPALDDLLAKYAWSDRNMSRHEWSAVVELAEMWQLCAMCWAAKKTVIKYLEWECDGHLSDMIRAPSTTAAVSKVERSGTSSTV